MNKPCLAANVSTGAVTKGEKSPACGTKERKGDKV
jgi:hypothetical protein